MLEALAALLLVAGTLGLASGLLHLRRALRGVVDAQFRHEVVMREAQRLQRAEQQLAHAQQLSESAVAIGTDVVRGVHRGIAAIPFGILEAIPATRDTTRIVRKTHDLISDVVYGSIGAVNRGVGAKLRDGLQAPQSSTPAADPSSPPPLSGPSSRDD